MAAKPADQADVALFLWGATPQPPALCPHHGPLWGCPPCWRNKAHGPQTLGCVLPFSPRLASLPRFCLASVCAAPVGPQMDSGARKHALGGEPVVLLAGPPVPG